MRSGSERISPCVPEEVPKQEKKIALRANYFNSISKRIVLNTHRPYLKVLNIRFEKSHSPDDIGHAPFLVLILVGNMVAITPQAHT